MKKHTSGELIEALKSGQQVKRVVNPNVGFDTTETTTMEGESYFVYGWGSALGNGKDRVLLMISNPELFTL